MPILRLKNLLCIFLLLWGGSIYSQLKIASWNLQNFGKTKSSEEISFVANILKEFDLVAIQEVVAGYGGSQAVARLANALNRSGSKWDYKISLPTESSPYSSERYAYIWKTAAVKKIGRAWLAKNFQRKIEREPFLMTFSYQNQRITLVNIHAIPKKKQPETELKYLKFLTEIYPTQNLIFLGDFNLPQSHTVFFPLKNRGYKPVLKNQKTTMKMRCVASECLASEYDNIFYNGLKMTTTASGIIRFYTEFPDMVKARRISDHVPIWAEFQFKHKEKIKK